MITALDRNTALVLIDLQKGIVGPHLAQPVETVVANASRLIDAFHEAGLPVVAVNVDPSGAPWLRSRIESPTPVPPEGLPKEFSELLPELPYRPSDARVTKRTWSAFFETGLHEVLQSMGVTGIVLGGVTTSIGVEGSARDASRLCYNIAFATDAMGDRSAEAHEHSTTRIFPRLGETGTTEQILSALRRPG